MGALFEQYNSLFLLFDFSFIRKGSSRICLRSWFLWFFWPLAYRHYRHLLCPRLAFPFLHVVVIPLGTRL